MTFLFWLISRLPLRVLHAIGGALGLFVARLPGRYGQRLKENFLTAFPDATDEMLAEAARSTGRMIMEMPYFWSRKRVTAPLFGFNEFLWPELDRLQKQANGVIILTPHLGCFEVLPQSHAEVRPVTALFKPPHQPWLRDWIERMRTRPNLYMAPATPRGVRMLVKALKRGESVGILPDQVPSGGEELSKNTVASPASFRSPFPLASNSRTICFADWSKKNTVSGPQPTHASGIAVSVTTWLPSGTT